MAAAEQIEEVLFTNMFHFVCFDVEFELRETLRKIDDIITLNHNRTPPLAHHVFITVRTELKLPTNKDVPMTVSATLKNLDTAIRNSEGNIVMNIFGHGNRFSRSIENYGNRVEDITPSILTEFGTTYPEKYFVYVFCSCHANPSFINMEPENIFAIVPRVCGTIDNTNCLPEELLTMYTVSGADYAPDGVYTCYSKNNLETSKIFLSLDIPYKYKILDIPYKYKERKPDPDHPDPDHPDSDYEYEDESSDEEPTGEPTGETTGEPTGETTGETSGGKRKTRKSKRKRKTRKSKRTRKTRKSKRTRKTRKSKRTRKIKSFRIKV